MKHIAFFTKLSLIAFTLIITSSTVQAQKDFTKTATKLFEGGSYFQAIESYKVAYSKEKVDSKKAEILYRIGQCYDKIHDLAQAEVWYKKAISANYPEPETILNLADVIKSQQRYDEALEYYKKFDKAKPGDERASRGIESCKLAQEWKDSEPTHKVQNEVLLNSKQVDYSVAFADKKYNTIIFSSSREGASGEDKNAVNGESYSDIWSSTRDNKGKWSTPVSISNVINTADEEGTPTLDGKQSSFFFCRIKARENGTVDSKIYTARKSGKNYTGIVPVKLGPDSFLYSHPAVSDDGTFLVYTSNRTDIEGTKGSMDLFVTTYNKKLRKWSEEATPIKSVNTAQYEAFPYVHPNGDLYFSSDGHIGMGGLDIFVAKKTGERTWGEPVNMRPPINSAGDDLGIVFEGEKQRGYFTSTRDGGRGKDDIYSFFVPAKVYKLEGKITNVKTKEIIEGATIALTGSDGSKYETKSDGTGFYEFDIISGTTERYIKENTNYNILVTAPDHLNAKGEESTVGIDQSTVFVHDFALIRFREADGSAGEIKMPEVRYEFNSADLTNEAKDSLDFLYQTLIDNPTLVIELSAHTDSRGSDKYNQALSQRRAKSCVDFLITKGIDARRMQPKGYGESRLIITDAEIAKMATEAESEAAHQKNRRTVFSVIRADFQP